MRILLSISLLLFLFSCKKETGAPADVGYDYFPEEVGRYITYQVDSIVFNDFTETIDTFYYQIKEHFDSAFYDNEGRLSTRITRYKKEYNDSVAYDNLPWTLKDVWYVTKTAGRVEQVEENIRYVKLVFPIINNKEWNGNALNNLIPREYEYDEVHEENTYQGLFFDSTTTVLQIDMESLINKDYYVEVFAKGVGLVYKEIIDVDADGPITPDPLMERVTSGFLYKMEVIDYGTE